MWARPGWRWKRLLGVPIVQLLRVSCQYVAGPVMTQPTSVGLTQQPNATSMICAR
ncbi:hypothetical protein ACKI2C_41825 [Streptomyces brasiliscabiei]|uniref:Uncharacterized protein n=1 Tax=Streptomyces brasiliscabiei TaxID=2736302 RepID=A0ABU8GD19_9ACTN